METVELDLMDSEWYELMKLAHERDITLNQLCNHILRERVYDIAVTTEYQVVEEPTASKMPCETPWDLK
jgi:hypothetical protein